MATKTSKGSIIQLEKDKPKGKCRKWRLVMSLGRDPMTGKYPQKARVFHGTFTEAQKALREFGDEIANDTVVRKNTWTYNEYAAHFMAQRVESGDYATRTLHCNKSSIDTVGFLVGALNMQDISPKVIEQAYKDLRNGKSPSGQPLCGSTLHRIHLNVCMMMDKAVAEGVIGVNPCKLVDKPKVDTKEKRSLSAEEAKKLLAALDPAVSMECGAILCLSLGLRRSEVVALSWGDVDFDSGLVHITHSSDENGDLKDPKTKAGRRTLPMTDTARDALMARRDAHIAETAKGSETDASEVVLQPGDPVICDCYGKRALPGTFSYWWRNHRKDYGLEGFGLHLLRHTFLSLAAAQGVHPSIMQKLAGHSTPMVTMEIYTHVNMESQRRAMDSIQMALAM